MQKKLDRFLLTHKATPTALGTSPRELHMNRQSGLRFNVLRAKSLKQHYVKRKCKEKPKTAFGPTFADLNKVGSILANVIYNNQVFTSTKLYVQLKCKRTHKRFWSYFTSSTKSALF